MKKLIEGPITVGPGGVPHLIGVDVTGPVYITKKNALISCVAIVKPKENK